MIEERDMREEAEIQEQTQLAKECLQEGKMCYAKNQMPEAMRLLLRAKEVALAVNNKQICAEASNVMGVLYGALGSVNIAIDYYLEALQYAEACEYGRMMALCMNNIGSRYQDLGDYCQAVEYFIKCEELLEKYGLLEQDKEIPTATVTCLNLIDSYCALGEYMKAEAYVKKAAFFIEKDPKHEYEFAFSITTSRMKWKRGDFEYVKAHLQELLKQAYNDTNTANFVQNMTGVCELLKWMEQKEAWEKLLEHLETYVGCLHSVYLESFVLEMWLLFYKETGQEELYRNKCVEYTQIHLRAKQQSDMEKVAAINTKIDVYKMQHDRKKAEKKYYLDPLTGMGNRTKLKRDYAAIADVAQRENTKLAMGVIDIDYFKCVNDTYGHLDGDECLCKVAKVLYDAVYEKGEVYRIGGDEFVILVSGMDEAAVEQLAQKIKSALHKLAIPNENSKVLSEVTLSQGYVCKRLHEQTTMKEIFLEADNVLYNVKNAGRNDYQVKGK